MAAKEVQVLQLLKEIEAEKAEATSKREAGYGAVMESGKRDSSALTAEVPEGYTKVSEGLAVVLAGRNKDGSQEVFYNPAQVVNRDMSILAIRGYNQWRQTKRAKRGRGRAPDEGLRILEGLSATGLRAIRYWKEIPGIDRIIVNDLDPSAVEAIQRNLEFNKVPLSKVVPNCDDAIALMNRLAEGNPSTASYRVDTSRDVLKAVLGHQKMDVVDLDPYGTAAPFLESALACVEEGGLMCVTCTDCDVLCGVHPEACHHKYGAITVRAKYCHEMAVRILLGCIERHAIKHGKYIQPLLSLQIDFYVRVFIRVFTSKAETKLSVGKLGHLLQCTACSAFRVRPLGTVKQEPKEDRAARKRRRAEGEQEQQEQEEEGTMEEDVTAPPGFNPAEFNVGVPSLPGRDEPRIKYGTGTTRLLNSTLPPQDGGVGCSVCGRSVWLGGPVWIAKTHEKEYVESLIATLDAEPENFAAAKRVRALLAAARDELPDCPLFYHVPGLCATLHIGTIPIVSFNSALLNLGYRVSQVHCNPDGVKTDAPPEVVYDILKEWHKLEVANASDKATLPKRCNIGPAKDILQSPTTTPGISFEYHSGAAVKAKVTGESKWGKNYDKGWGPQARAKGKRGGDDA